MYGWVVVTSVKAAMAVKGEKSSTEVCLMLREYKFSDRLVPVVTVFFPHMILTSSPMNDTLKPRLVADRTLNKFAPRPGTKSTASMVLSCHLPPTRDLIAMSPQP